MTNMTMIICWDMLKGYGFPENFTNQVKAMYSKAKNLNKLIPAPIKVIGVQQGDPMS